MMLFRGNISGTSVTKCENRVVCGKHFVCFLKKLMMSSVYSCGNDLE
jgi:hypothetical protein